MTYFTIFAPHILLHLQWDIWYCAGFMLSSLLLRQPLCENAVFAYILHANPGDAYSADVCCGCEGGKVIAVQAPDVGLLFDTLL